MSTGKIDVLVANLTHRYFPPTHNKFNTNMRLGDDVNSKHIWLIGMNYGPGKTSSYAPFCLIG